MDPLTHAVAGGLASGSMAIKKEVRPAIFVGLVSGMLADLDFFIYRHEDPLFTIEVHRQFTHSLVFIPVGALIAAILLFWFVRDRLPFSRVYLFAFAAYATAGLLDACTSYGTVLLWPFSENRFAWNLISILDPMFSVGLLMFLFFSLFRWSPLFARLAWVWVTLYLAFGFVQRERADRLTAQLANQRSHVIEHSVVKPTLGNLVLWRSTYIADGRVYADGIRVGLVRGDRIYEGDSSPLVIPQTDFQRYRGTTLFEDLIRMSDLSEGYLVRHPEKPLVVGDARYAMLPTSLSPLWGVVVDTTRADEHLSFLYFRESGPDIRAPWLKMLRGQ